MSDTPTLDQQRQRLRGLLEEHVPDHVDAILGTARSSLRLFPEPPTSASGVVGGTRFGGSADLPSAKEWPHHAGKPLVFLVQLRLEELPDFDGRARLPESGLLSFFTAGGWWGDADAENDELMDAYGTVGAVLHHPSIDGLVAVPPPYGDGDGDPLPVAHRAIRFVEELCLPPLEGPAFDPLELRGTEGYSVYWDEVWMNRAAFDEEPFHRLFGHPDMNFNYRLGADRILLLQVCSDDAIEWEHGDYQPVRFEIGTRALEDADFSDVTVDSALM